MRIVHTESSLGWGGQEIRILKEAQLLKTLGHEVLLICDHSSLIAQRLDTLAPGIEKITTRLRAKRPLELFKIRSILKRIKPDIVVCHSSTDHWLTAVSRVSIARKFPIVRMRHVSAPIQQNLSTKWLYRRGCDSIATTGQSIRATMINNGLCSARKVWSIPTGLDLTQFQTFSRSEAREKLRMSPDETFVGIVATLRTWKGHVDLLHAMLRVKRFVRLLVVGEGPQFQALQALTNSLNLSGRVVFVGHQNEVVPWFAALDVYAQPSYANEGVPQSILQAMATGLPVISCPTGGIPEAVAGYSCVQLVPPHSPDKLGEAINNAVDSLTSLPHREILSYAPFTESAMSEQCDKLYRKTFDSYRNA